MLAKPANPEVTTEAMEEKKKEDYFEDAFELVLFLYSNPVESHATKEEYPSDSDPSLSYVLPPVPFTICQNPVTVVA